EYVVLQFNNINGVKVGQQVVLGDFNTPNGVKSFNIFEVYDSLMVHGVTEHNLVTVVNMEKSVYDGLIDSTDSQNPSIIEFSPMYTEVVEVLSNNVIKIKSVKGAFKQPQEEIYIGSLGD